MRREKRRRAQEGDEVALRSAPQSRSDKGDEVALRSAPQSRSDKGDEAAQRQARRLSRLLRRRAETVGRPAKGWGKLTAWTGVAVLVLCMVLIPATTPAQAPQSQMTSGEAGQNAPRIIYGQDDGTAGAGAVEHGPLPDAATGNPFLRKDDTRPDPMAARVPPESAGTGGDASTNLLDDARRRWQEAVRMGRTDLGFRAWLIEALSVELPGETGTDSVSGDAAPALRNGDARASRRNPDSPQAQRTRDVSARWTERAGPVVLGEAGRVVTVFGASIPTAFCAPLVVCTIELEPGEQLTDTPSWGDTVRWQVATKVQGDDPETMVFEIKPSDDAGATNLIIPTDRRLYNITLVKDDRVHTPILSFSYPDTAQKQAKQRIADRKAKKAEEARRAAAAKAAAARKREQALERNGVETASGLKEASKLDFSFRVTGSAPFRPVRVYSDGSHTYIDLKPSYNGPLPALVPGRSEENKVLNTRVEAGGTRLVADRVIRDMWLQAGKRRVRIRRTGR